MRSARRASRRAGERVSWLAAALFALTTCIAFLPSGEAARFEGTIKEPVSWTFLSKFCFLPADTGGYVNDVHGMVSTKIKFHITSQFALLHYITATGSEKAENSDSVANWDDVYNSKSTCLERINNEFAFPFYLAELARSAVPAPPPPPAPPSAPPANASASRRLLAADDEARSAPRAFSVGEKQSARGFERHTAAFASTSLSDEPFVEIPLRYSNTPTQKESVSASSPHRRSLRLVDDDEHGTYDPSTGKTTYVINGQAIVVDGNQAGSNTAFGLGLIDITQVNAVDAYTNLPLDNSAKLRIYGGGWVEVVRTTFYVGDRARFFYVAGANCDRLCSTSTCNGDMDISYEIEFTNGFHWYSKHFSADEIGVLETSIAFLVLYVLLGACYFLTRKELKKLRKHHHTVKMLGSAIILAFFSHGFFFLHYIWYSSDGVGNMLFLFVARILQLSSETTFLVLLVLIAKGWTICCRKISARGRVKIAVFATVYAICWLLAVAYHHFVADKASTLHMYQSAFGYFLCALRFFALGWFWYSVSVTNKKYASKVAFYKKFAASFALWFYGLPIIVIVAQSIPPWQRFMVVNAVEFTFLFAFQLALLAMYVPNSGFNKSFPFHATTNETFLYAGNRPAAMRSANGARRVTVGSAGAAPNGDGRGAAKPGRPGELSDWDKKELARAVHSAKVMTHETKKILDCLTQIESNNELESDDEAYDEAARATPLRTLGSSGATRGVATVEQLPRLLRVFKSLPEPQQQVITDITRRMGEGMASFAGADLTEGTTTMDDYNLYCHYVAGLVGEGLSSLFARSGLEDASLESQLDLANDMGLFLQKTNIIRDFLEDYVDGRTWWPREIWGNYVAHMWELADEGKRPEATACLNHMVTDALELVPSCIAYLDQLEDEAVMRFCLIPQLMAIATQAACFNNPHVFSGIVKIRPGLSAKLILSTKQDPSAQNARTWFAHFGAQIKANVDPADPNAERTMRALEALEECCRGEPAAPGSRV